MKPLILGLGLLGLLGACQTGNDAQTIVPEDQLGIVVPDLPEGYPWKMGDVVLIMGGSARPYTTYDFSIGAFDAAVQLRAEYDCSGTGSCEDTGKVLLSMRAHPGADPDAKAEVLFVSGVFDTLPGGPAEAQNVIVQISGAQGWDGKMLMSGSARMKITAIKRGKDGRDAYGTLSATVTATVCDAVDEVLTPGGACQDITASFETEVQYDSV